MIVYYAPGGGLGHRVRARRVLAALGVRTSSSALITTDDLPRELEGDIPAHRRWIDSLGAERIIADSFQPGIQGELSGVVTPLDHVARLLRWDEYRNAVDAPLPRFGTTWLVEEVTHEAILREISDRVEPLTLRVEDEVPPNIEGEYWLIVHSGPADEVRELIDYTLELNPPRVLVATRAEVDLPPNFERVDAPAYAGAARIISAAGFNVMLETEPWRDKHHVVPFPRRFDYQLLRAERRRVAQAFQPVPGGMTGGTGWKACATPERG